MSSKSYKLTSKVLLYPGMAGWHFLIVPKKESGTIKEKYGRLAKGWGSLPVSVTIGKTIWKSSIFPDRRASSYLLPLKAKVRKAEDIWAGDTVSYAVKLLV